MKASIIGVWLGAALAGPALAADCSVSLAQAFDAAGGAKWKALETMTLDGHIEIPGLTGAFGSVTDLRDGRFADHVELGPFKQRSGYDGAAQWSEEKRGDVHVQDDELTRQEGVADRYDRTMSYWIDGRMKGAAHCVGDRDLDGARYSVHAVEPAGGRPFELWVDPKTKLVARRVSRNGPVESVSAYSDYRDVDGVKVAHAMAQSASNAPTVTTLHIEHVRFGAAPAEAFARPAAALDDYAFPSGADRVEFDVRVINNHVYVPVKFNGKGPYWVILDTGGSNVITPRLARELGLKIEGEFSATGAGDASEKASLTHVDALDVGGVTLNDQNFIVIDFEKLSDVEGVDQAGLVGYEVYRRLVVREDYEHSKLALIEPSKYEPPAGAAVVPFAFRETIPVVDGEIDGVPGQFVVDTGSRSELWMNVPFAQAHGFRDRYAQKVVATTGWGVGGAVRGEVARGGALKVGPVAFDGPIVDVSLNKGGASAEEHIAGNIGGGLLKRHVVTFDYARQRIVFEPRGTQERNDFDRSGLWLNRAKDGFEVIDVVEAGPAARAGIERGDRVVKVGGKAASAWTLGDLRAYLRTQPAGSRVAIEVDRAGRRSNHSLQLTDLLPPWPPAAHAAKP